MESIEKPDWHEYYEKTVDVPARELLLICLDSLQNKGKAPGTAIDIGCGAGNETIELLKRGWQVVAIDNQPEALGSVVSRTPDSLRGSLTVELQSLEDLHLPQTELIWAGYSLSFCGPDRFGDMWRNILDCMAPGAVFAGNIFGPNHVWAANEQMTFLNMEQVKRLFEGLVVEHFAELDQPRMTATAGVQHWHDFSVIARRG